MTNSKNYIPGIANQIRNDLEGLETMLGILNTLHYGNDKEPIEEKICALKDRLNTQLADTEKHLINARVAHEHPTR